MGGTSYDTSYTATGLNTANPYTFVFVPYDSMGVSGESLEITTHSLSLFTAGTITTGTVTVSSIELLFQGIFSTVYISRNGTTLNGGNPVTPINGVASYTDSGLSEYTIYTYTLSPYDENSDPGSSATISANTLYVVPYINSLTTGVETTSTIQLVYPGLYSYVNIYRDGQPIAYNVTDSSYTDTSLNLNTPYTYFVIPYGNSVHGAAQSITAYTIPVLRTNSLMVTNINVSALKLSYEGTFDTVSIYRNGTMIASGYTSSTYTDDNIYQYSNQLLTYQVEPHNAMDTGSSSSVSIYTLPSLA